MRPLSWKIERAKVGIEEILEETDGMHRGVYSESYAHIPESIFRDIDEELAASGNMSSPTLDALEASFVDEYVLKFIRPYLDSSSPRAFDKGLNADELLDFGGI
jgi:hypothetical protein